MRISVGSDDTGPLPEWVVEDLRARGHEVLCRGDLAGAHEEYVDVAEAVARDVAENRADEGVVMCWTGTGVTIAANKVAGIRAALCQDAETARGARRWNHANVLALSMRAITPAVAREILDGWLQEQFGQDPVDRENVEKLAILDGRRAVKAGEIGL